MRVFDSISEAEFNGHSFFLVVGFLFVLTEPSIQLSKWLFYGYVLSRFGHFLVYATAQIHEVRATFWTIGSVIIITMAIMVLNTGLQAL